MVSMEHTYNTYNGKMYSFKVTLTQSGETVCNLFGVVCRKEYISITYKSLNYVPELKLQ